MNTTTCNDPGCTCHEAARDEREAELLRKLQELRDVDEACGLLHQACADAGVPPGHLADRLRSLAKPRWIPVTERLPELGVRVLVIGERGLTRIDWIVRPAIARPWAINGTVTHWMPLPHPPEAP